MAIPIILLHGFMGKGSDWNTVVKALKRAGIDAHALDLPGHGAEPLVNGEQSYASWSEWLASRIAALGYERVGLVGYSLGGRIALSFALSKPKMVAALVLESANPGIENLKERAARAHADDARGRFIIQHGLRAFLEEWYTMPLFASLRARPALLREIVDARASQSAAAMAQVITSLSPGKQPALWRQLPTLKPPSLWLAGALDPKYPTIARKAAQATHGKALIVPFAGHNIHAERPKCFSAVLLAFMRRVDAAKTYGL